MVRYGCGGWQCEMYEKHFVVRRGATPAFREEVEELCVGLFGTGGREKLSFEQEMEFSRHRDGHDKKHRGQDQSGMEEKVWRFW